jgi:hypothetical protein
MDFLEYCQSCLFFLGCIIILESAFSICHRENPYVNCCCGRIEGVPPVVRRNRLFL